MGASRWFECEEQTRFTMMRHDCLYFGSGSFSKIHTQRLRGRSSRTHNCNDPSGEMLRCDTPPRHNAKANSQIVKADFEELRWDIKRFPLKPTVMNNLCYSQIVFVFMFVYVLASNISFIFTFGTHRSSYE